MSLRRKPVPSNVTPGVSAIVPDHSTLTYFRDEGHEQGGAKFYHSETNSHDLAGDSAQVRIRSAPNDQKFEVTYSMMLQRKQDSLIETSYDDRTRTLPEKDLIGSLSTKSSIRTQTPATEATSLSVGETGFADNTLARYSGLSEYPVQSNKSEKTNKVASVLQDASTFLGGLIEHPTESTKQFTILRHSHGLVYYKGPETSVTVTTFSEAPLSHDRRYWLQMKGWTGNAGLRAKAFFRTNGNWINVTPKAEIPVSELSPTDERAWQRDIQKFQRKAPKPLKKHIPRETAIIRVPFEAVDGYFRVVLTGADSRWPLCSSPVFRVASTSISAASIRGASLSTLPLELGISVLQRAATTIGSNVVAPLAQTARDQISSALPPIVSDYGQTAYDVSDAPGRINALNQDYDGRRKIALQQTSDKDEHYYPNSRPDVIGEDTGPESPFPIQFECKVVKGSGPSRREFGIPSASLDGVPADIVATLEGTYFGWALVTHRDKSLKELTPEWCHTLITITYDNAKTGVAVKKDVRAHIVHDFAGRDFYGAGVSLVIMGFLRPAVSHKHKEAFLAQIIQELEMVEASLNREQWGPELALQRIRTAKSERSFTDRYVDTRMAVQRRIDSVPVHRLGVRSQSLGLKDRGLYGNGGLHVIRDHSRNP